MYASSLCKVLELHTNLPRLNLECKQIYDDNYTKILYLVSLSIWSYIMFYILVISVNLYQVKMLLLYNVQPTNSSFFDKN